MTKFPIINSHQRAIVIVPVIGVTLATVCVVLRFRARRIRKQAILFDDWLCLAALIMTWIFQGINIAAVLAGGAGLPIEYVLEIDQNAVVTYMKILFANFLVWFCTVTVVQLSILFFYIRIFGISRVFKFSCYVMVILVSLLWIAGFFSQVFNCVPVSKMWNPSEPGTCLPYMASCASVSVLHVAFDLAIVVLPMPMIWQLQASRRSKVLLSGLLCLGLVATVLSFIKISCIFDLTGIPQTNVTEANWLPIVLQTLELPIGIICCCVPSLQPAVAEISTSFNSITSQLLSFTQRSRTSTVDQSYNSANFATDNDSKAHFARLDDTPSQTERGRFKNQAVANQADIELSQRGGQPPLPQGRDINVTNEYTVNYD